MSIFTRTIANDDEPDPVLSMSRGARRTREIKQLQTACEKYKARVSKLEGALKEAKTAMTKAHAALELSDNEMRELEWPIDGPARENIRIGVVSLDAALARVREAIEEE